MSNADEVIECLKIYNIEQYANGLKSHGLDTLHDMKNLTTDEIEEICNQMNMPIFHKKRFKNACDAVTNNKYPPQLSTNNHSINPINNTEQTVTIDQKQPVIRYIVTKPYQPIPTQTVVVLNTEPQTQQIVVKNNNNPVQQQSCTCCKRCCKVYGYCQYIVSSLFIYFFAIISIKWQLMYFADGDVTYDGNDAWFDIYCYADRLEIDQEFGYINIPDNGINDMYKIFYFSDLCDGGIPNACSLQDAGNIFIGFTIFALVLLSFGLLSMILFKLKNLLIRVEVIKININKIKHFLLIFSMVNFVLAASFLIVGCLNFVLNDSIDLCRTVFVDKYTSVSIEYWDDRVAGGAAVSITAFVLLMILIIVSSIHYPLHKTK
eukprot:272461_1